MSLFAYNSVAAAKQTVKMTRGTVIHQSSIAPSVSSTYSGSSAAGSSSSQYYSSAGSAGSSRRSASSSYSASGGSHRYTPSQKPIVINTSIREYDPAAPSPYKPNRAYEEDPQRKRQIREDRTPSKEFSKICNIREK